MSHTPRIIMIAMGPNQPRGTCPNVKQRRDYRRRIRRLGRKWADQPWPTKPTHFMGIPIEPR